ncbi:transposable element Tcb1 transposase [Trichonephila clavipes]|nr:transposable element Tcb1 transposase [Trichonephila clavipes]
MRYSAATSRTIAQQIPSVTHQSMSARTIRRCLQQSGMSVRRPLIRLHLSGNHTRLRHQWCDERRTWTMLCNNTMFTDESCFCQQHCYGQM